MTPHPRLDNHGNIVSIHDPHAPSPLDFWHQAKRTAIGVPNSPMPSELNGLPIQAWLEPPTDALGWECLGEREAFMEPPFETAGLAPAAGAVVVERDGRVWLVAPTNGFAGIKITFPKGKADGWHLRATARKEVFEESGLNIELLSHLVDLTRSTSRTRYYVARRVGGSPADMGWESQAVFLAPMEELPNLLHHSSDLLVLEAMKNRWGQLPSWFSS